MSDSRVLGLGLVRFSALALGSWALGEEMWRYKCHEKGLGFRVRGNFIGPYKEP